MRPLLPFLKLQNPFVLLSLPSRAFPRQWRFILLEHFHSFRAKRCECRAMLLIVVTAFNANTHFLNFEKSKTEY
ncbi:hypothetical protein VV7356_15590 [Vibrio vulnificus]|nr:hypothetical protein CRN45_02495 [Vibrio vulnificus]POC65994.1 hypothetical protein CRN44_04555 [Vibrio vulnificus]